MTYCIRNMTLESFSSYVVYFDKSKCAESVTHSHKTVSSLKTRKKLFKQSPTSNVYSYISNLVPSPLKCYCAFNSIGKCPIIFIRACQEAGFNPLLPQPKDSRKKLENAVHSHHPYPNTLQP